MFLKIKKANDEVAYLSLGPTDRNKGHIVFNENGAFDAIRCFASRRQAKCKNCGLVHTIEGCMKRKKDRDKNKILKR
jgi:hypothetical protein